ncbi:MAG: DUF2141 domain-containing protein [Alphaproteobacteria bacterium]|jgi:uncharacterized protein (DUF2141 family)|nr:DUF2141 domain-containing protein [Alphaproteobacteria bacterium]
MRTLSLSTVAAALLLVPAFAQAGDLSVMLENVANADGALLVGVHTKSADFPDDASHVSGQMQAAQAGEITVHFKNLPAGRYAIALLHDANSNGKLDSNRLGIPVEGVGFSNNATGSFGPPAFAKAAFDVPADGVVTQSIKLAY